MGPIFPAGWLGGHGPRAGPRRASELLCPSLSPREVTPSLDPAFPLIDLRADPQREAQREDAGLRAHGSPRSRRKSSTRSSAPRASGCRGPAVSGPSRSNQTGRHSGLWSSSLYAHSVFSLFKTPSKTRGGGHVRRGDGDSETPGGTQGCAGSSTAPSREAQPQGQLQGFQDGTMSRFSSSGLGEWGKLGC